MTCAPALLSVPRVTALVPVPDQIVSCTLATCSLTVASSCGWAGASQHPLPLSASCSQFAEWVVHVRHPEVTSVGAVGPLRDGKQLAGQGFQEEPKLAEALFQTDSTGM